MNIKKLNVLVLMAGEAKRFKSSDYNQIKPLIQVNGKSILEWTLSSLPGLDLIDCDYYFAIQYKHDIEYGITDFLNKKFGPNINIIRFNACTRGNLETAFFTFLSVKNKENPLLILDSDNLYDGSSFFNRISYIREKTASFASICYFDPLDDSSKWCFAFPDDNNRIKKLSEKDPAALSFNGKPMVGVFYFEDPNLFVNSSKFILNNNALVKNEFFMSQSIEHLIENNNPVYGVKVTSVNPLGTPEDVRKYENSN